MSFRIDIDIDVREGVDHGLRVRRFFSLSFFVVEWIDKINRYSIPILPVSLISSLRETLKREILLHPVFRNKNENKKKRRENQNLQERIIDHKKRDKQYASQAQEKTEIEKERYERDYGKNSFVLFPMINNGPCLPYHHGTRDPAFMPPLAPVFNI